MDEEDLTNLGIVYLKLSAKKLAKMSQEQLVKKFQKNYGSTPGTTLKIWNELRTTNIQEARLNKQEESKVLKKLIIGGHPSGISAMIGKPLGEPTG